MNKARDLTVSSISFIICNELLIFVIINWNVKNNHYPGFLSQTNPYLNISYTILAWRDKATPVALMNLTFLKYTPKMTTLSTKWDYCEDKMN